MVVLKATPRPPALWRRFFYLERSLDCSGMHIEIECLLKQLRQLARSDWFAWRKLSLEESQHLALEFVRPPRSSLPGNQPGNARFLEMCLGLVEGWPREAVFAGGGRHRCVLDGDTAQHLVLDLYRIAGIEEVALVKLGIVDLVWRRVQRAFLEEGIGLCALLFVVLDRHGGIRALDGTRKYYKYCRFYCRCQARCEVKNSKKVEIAP